MLETTNKIGLNSIILETDGTDCLENAKSHQTIKNFSIEFAEKQLIARALQESKGKKTKAASMLGISRATLYAKVKQYNIENQNQNVTSNQPEPYLV
jgi:DNA-binding NtrC family response regulator